MADTPNLEVHFQPVAVFDGQTAGTENRNNKPKPSSFYEIEKFVSGALGEHLASGDPFLGLGAHRRLYRLEAFLRAAEQLQLRTGVVDDDVRIPKQLYGVDIVRQLQREGHLALIRIQRRGIELSPSSCWQVHITPEMRMLLEQDILYVDE